MIFIKKHTTENKATLPAYFLRWLYFKLSDFYPQKARTSISVPVILVVLWVIFVQYACPVHQVSNYFT